MSTSLISKRFLNLKGVRSAIIKTSDDLDYLYQHGSENVPLHHIAKSVILRDSQSTVMAIIPAENEIRINTLNKHLHRNLKLIQQVNLRGYQLHCSIGSLPCLGEAFGFETIIDESLLDHDYIYFTSGSPDELIRLSIQDFQLLHSNAWYGNTFSEGKQIPPKIKQTTIGSSDTPPVSKIRRLIDTLNNLPPMPTMALEIMQLNLNPYTHVDDLAKLIESDPSLSAQIIRHAQSPLYGYKGQITSVQQAISRVLGYDIVMNIALGITTTRPFRNTISGPLGNNAYWRHATYSAAVCQSICSLMPHEHRPRAGMAYLCGLLHNFGFLLLGHLYPQDLVRLNKAVNTNPLTATRIQEEKLLQIDHTVIGSQLMKSWHMPAEIIVTQLQHHNIDYNGEHANYAKLVMLTDILLKGHGLGDADFNEIPTQLLQQLNVREEQLYVIFEKTIQARKNLDIMAMQLAA